jgi:oxygen-independent coproporphyrinogen III oxidase
MEGSDLSHVAGRFGVQAAQELERRAALHVTSGNMILTERLILTQGGKLLADGIAADLFFSDADGFVNTGSPALPTG